MPNIVALVSVDADKFRIVSDNTSVVIGDAEQTRMFVNSMKNGNILEYFSARSRQMAPADYNWEEIVDMEGNGAVIESLLQLNTYFQFLNETRFVAPIGETLASCIAENIPNSESLFAEGGTRTLPEILEEIAALL